MEARSLAWRRRLSWICVSVTWRWSRSSFKGGESYGESDELGYKAAVNRLDVHDLHAPILHLLGLDHERLNYFHNGRRYRLTDVSGRVIHDVLQPTTVTYSRTS